MFYRFGGYQLDIESRKLCLKGVVVSDDEKTIKLLESLCVHYPEVVDKQPLMELIWPDQVVTDWSLSRLVSDTRQLLGDSGKDQGHIKTIRGRGFRLNTVVEESDGKVALLPRNQANKSYSNTIKPFALVASIALVAVIIFLFVKPKSLEAVTGLPFRVAVLPVVSENNAPIDEWIKYGIMSMASEQLGRYEALQTIPVSTIINEVATASENFYERAMGDEQFREICSPLGCTHLVALNYRLDENNRSVLSYQVLSQGYRSPISEFSESDIMDAADMMFDYLATELIPGETERLSLEDTYSNDSKANRDYAIGVHELLSGDITAAKDYLELAIQRKPDFFWARAYLAEVHYREGKFSSSIEMIKQLKALKQDGHRSYFLEHLYSNILYGQGKLEKSQQVSIALLDNDYAANDPMLKGNELLNIGSSFQALGKLEEATSYLEQSLEQYKLAKFGSGEGKALYNLANVYLYALEKQKAIDLYIAAREIFKKYGMTGYALMAKHQIANTSIYLGRVQYAEGELRALITAYKKVGDLEGELTAETDLILVSLEKNDHKEAEMRAQRLLKRLEPTEFSYLHNHALVLAVRCNLEMNNIAKAEEYYNRFDSEWNDIRPGFIFIPAYIQHGKGNFAEAVSMVKKVKEDLGDSWSSEHQTILEQLEASLLAGQSLEVTYY